MGGTGLVTGVYGTVPEGPGGDPRGLREMEVGMGGVGRELVGWWDSEGTGGFQRVRGHWRGVPVGTGGPKGDRHRTLVEVLGDSWGGLGDREGLVGIPGNWGVVLVVHRGSGALS